MQGDGDRLAAGGDDGSAVVDFVLVGALLTVIFVAVVQLAVVLHVRNTLEDAATQGARQAALAGARPEDGAERARAMITASLSEDYARDVTVGTETVEGLETVVVRVRAPLPVLGFLGAGRGISVEGHALDEDAVLAGAGG